MAETPALKSPSRRHRLLRAALIAILCLPLVLVLLTVQFRPGVSPAPGLTTAETTGIEQLIVANAPANVSNTTLQNLQLNANELSLLLRYALEILNLQNEIGIQLQLRDRQIDADVSIPLHAGPLPVWLNLGARWTGAPEQLRLEAVQLGVIRIPASLVQVLLERLRRNYFPDSSASDDLRALVASVQSLTVEDQSLHLSLLWEPALIARLSNQARYFLVSDQDQQRILAHYAVLREVLESVPAASRAISLNSLLIPMFSAVAARNDPEPIAENRTLLMTLAMYVNEEDIEQLLGPELAADLPALRRIEVRVQRRQDLAQHIISSAAITASAGPGLAEIVSSTKEAYDARYRSGYSFSDLTANTAGVALGLAATESAASARLMQQRLAALSDESDYLPPVGNSSDGLTETDFNTLYRDNPEEYQRRIDEIESLVYSRPLFADR